MKLYLAGPMTGYPKSNHEAFDECAAALRANGHDVWSPAEHDRLCGLDVSKPVTPTMRRILLRADIYALLQCDGIAMMDGWRESKGATLEHAIAEELGMTILLMEPSS